MQIYGLIGRTLSHSFSKNYFTDKFLKEEIKDCEYKLFELEDIKEIKNLINKQPELSGLNVTIPYKEGIIPYLHAIDPTAKKINAVNVIKITPDRKLIGYNSDYFGFRQSLISWLPQDRADIKALILGTGGAAKAVKTVLADLSIPFQIVSRTGSEENISYTTLKKEKVIIAESQLIINTTPLGMSPHISQKPDLDYYGISSSHYLYDLIYNPEETEFLRAGRKNGAKTKNGLEMLMLQAEKSWEIWRQE